MNCKNCNCYIIVTKEDELLGKKVKCPKCGAEVKLEITTSAIVNKDGFYEKKRITK